MNEGKTTQRTFQTIYSDLYRMNTLQNGNIVMRANWEIETHVNFFFLIFV